MVSQLSPTTAIETIYKVGDRLKLRKKPLAASHLKRGDVIQVDAIHPKDGSIKFWNERSDRWEFIYPDEVGRIIDSPTPAEVAVGESNCPPGETDTTTHVDEVGESNCPPGDIDSPTSAEVAVGELNCPPADDYSATR